jgi:hypothetical protein
LDLSQRREAESAEKALGFHSEFSRRSRWARRPERFLTTRRLSGTPRSESSGTRHQEVIG